MKNKSSEGKGIKINNKQRDIILSKAETLVIGTGVCISNGKKYYYNPVTRKQFKKKLNKMLAFFEYWDKSWFYRLTHKEPKL